MKMYWLKHTIEYLAIIQLEGEGGEGEFEFRIDKVKLMYDDYPSSSSVNVDQGWVGSYISIRRLYTPQRLIKYLFEEIYK